MYSLKIKNKRKTLNRTKIIAFVESFCIVNEQKKSTVHVHAFSDPFKSIRFLRNELYHWKDLNVFDAEPLLFIYTGNHLVLFLYVQNIIPSTLVCKNFLFYCSALNDFDFSWSYFKHTSHHAIKNNNYYLVPMHSAWICKIILPI